jgi:hypothetical protein
VSTLQTFFAGIDPDHVPALLAGLLYAVVATATSLVRRGSGAVSNVPLSDRVAGRLLMDSAVIHVALPIGHHDDPTLTVLFLLSAVAYGWLGWFALVGRRYKTASALLIAATLIAYIDVVATGGEGADQVGIVTALLELAALGICLTPSRARGPRMAFGGIAFVTCVVVSGVAIWATSFATHVSAGVADGHEAHQHSGSRAQAAVIMRPLESSTPTASQTSEAKALASRTRTSLARFTDIRDAIAAGYRPSFVRTGARVHLENPAYQKDGHVLDPQRPEMLMYAIVDGRAALLGAVFQMPRAGQPGPTPGGPITQWHAHDVCLTLFPPGMTVMSAYGTCPLLSISVTVAEMMHVWTVDHPGGPYNDDVPDGWIRAYADAHGVPFSWT